MLHDQSNIFIRIKSRICRIFSIEIRLDSGGEREEIKIKYFKALCVYFTCNFIDSHNAATSKYLIKRHISLNEIEINLKHF